MFLLYSKFNIRPIQQMFTGRFSTRPVLVDPSWVSTIPPIQSSASSELSLWAPTFVKFELATKVGPIVYYQKAGVVSRLP